MTLKRPNDFLTALDILIRAVGSYNEAWEHISADDAETANSGYPDYLPSPEAFLDDLEAWRDDLDGIASASPSERLTIELWRGRI
jgi:hypothetical protein